MSGLQLSESTGLERLSPALLASQKEAPAQRQKRPEICYLTYQLLPSDTKSIDVYRAVIGWLVSPLMRSLAVRPTVTVLAAVILMTVITCPELPEAAGKVIVNDPLVASAVITLSEVVAT